MGFPFPDENVENEKKKERRKTKMMQKIISILHTGNDIIVQNPNSLC